MFIFSVFIYLVNLVCCFLWRSQLSVASLLQMPQLASQPKLHLALRLCSQWKWNTEQETRKNSRDHPSSGFHSPAHLCLSMYLPNQTNKTNKQSHKVKLLKSLSTVEHSAVKHSETPIVQLSSKVSNNLRILKK